jgi:hypothetical protein
LSARHGLLLLHRYAGAALAVFIVLAGRPGLVVGYFVMSPDPAASIRG